MLFEAADIYEITAADAAASYIHRIFRPGKVPIHGIGAAPEGTINEERWLVWQYGVWVLSGNVSVPGKAIKLLAQTAVPAHGFEVNRNHIQGYHAGVQAVTPFETLHGLGYQLMEPNVAGNIVYTYWLYEVLL